MPADLVTAIRAAAAADAVVAPRITRRLITAFAHHLPTERTPNEPLTTLTSRERHVLVELAHARSNNEIAERPHVTQATVKVHISRILTKLGLRDRTQVVVLAYENGIVTRGD